MKRTVSVVILKGMVVVCAGADESFKIKSLENGKVPLGDTGLPAYSDTGYSDTSAAVTVFGSRKGSPFFLKING